MNRRTEINAKVRAMQIAKENGRDWNDMGGYERFDYCEAARKEIEKKA